MPVASRSRSREIVAVLITTLVMLGMYAVIQSTTVRDWWQAQNYAESAAVKQIREELGLTSKGERIFKAVQPAIEEAEDFNEHCNSHRVDISLLGCYSGDKMYIYEVDLPELKDSNKVTAAHELLHAVWARMGKGERNEIEQMLQGVRAQNADWAEGELALYQDSEQLEEFYTRVGTKLRDLPEDLEQHYQEYFQNRTKIVDFYESYQAPFNKLVAENEELKQEVAELGTVIEKNRTEYMQQVEILDLKIAKFNQCADVMGCFSSVGDFNHQRMELESEQIRLETKRIELNAKIDQYNAIVQQYQANQRTLGELNDAMNSNVNKIE